jgi:hypothetical protein
VELAIVAQRRTQLRDRVGQVRFFNEGIGPDFAEQLPLHPQVAGLRNQRHQKVERFGREGHWDAVAQQLPLARVEAVGTEDV